MIALLILGIQSPTIKMLCGNYTNDEHGSMTFEN